MNSTCTHLTEIKTYTPATPGICADCVKLGDSWVHLRLCLSCGYVGCCDNSKNKHATKHFHATTHPLIQSLEPNEGWIWCYIDQIIV